MMIATPFCPRCGAANEPAHGQCFACGQLMASENEREEARDGVLLRDRYLVGELLGSGGFSRVYRATDQLAGGRAVALKQIFLQGLNAQEAIEATETFHREVRMLYALTHAQVPRVRDHFSDQDHWYLVLEYIEGQTLETFLARREARGQPLHLDEILAIALQLCPVLQYLHSRQPPIIYRDLKPSNIMRTPRGSLFLIDFGIARHYRPGQAHDTQRLGSPGYAAPEQYGHTQTSPQSDIYSFGALLSFLLTGQDPAEDAEHPQSVAPRLQDHEDERRELAALVQRMRAPHPGARPESCQEVASVLEEIKLQCVTHDAAHIWRPPTAQTPPPQHTSAAGKQHYQRPRQRGHSPSPAARRHYSRRNVLIGFGVLTTVVAGVGVGWYHQKVDDARKVLTYQGSAGTSVNAVTWSPDSKRIASASDETVQVWDATTGHTILTYQGHTYSVSAVMWSPDGRWIASASGNTVQVWDATTGLTVLIYRGHAESVSTVAWSPDGRRIASASGNTVQVWDATTGSIASTTYRGESTVYRIPVAWSSDSKRIASASYNDTVQVWDIATGSVVLTYQGHTGYVDAVAWSPDGRSIASASGDTTVQVWDATTGSTVLTYRGGSTAYIGSVMWSPDSRRIASTSSDETVQVWDATTGSTVSTYPGPVNVVAWSPDGRHMAFTFADTVQVWNAPWNAS